VFNKNVLHLQPKQANMNSIIIDSNKYGQDIYTYKSLDGNKARITFLHPGYAEIKEGDEISSRLNRQVENTTIGLIVEKVHETRIAKGKWNNIIDHPFFFDVSCRFAPITVNNN